MTTFTPPVGEGEAWGDEYDPGPKHFFSYMGTIPTGETVWKDEAGVWHQGQYPSAGAETSTVHDDGNPSETTDPTSGLLTAQKVFQGGHTYDVDNTTALELIVAGFGAGINIQPVTGTWTTEEAQRFNIRMLLTADGSHASNGQFVSDNNKLTNKLIAGTTPGQSQLREFFLHTDMQGWTDVHGIIEIDPLLFQSDVDGNPSLDILPQTGCVLRAQLNNATGKNTGITMNNGTIFGIPTLNIGAWHGFPDGTGFANRQFSFPFPDFFTDGFNLPYGWEFYLEGNIIRVRTFKAGTSPDSISWTDPIRSRTLNLDTDCGSTATVPTMMTPGAVGVINAHMGTDPRSQCRIRRFFMERLS